MKKTFSTLLLGLTALITLSQDIKAPPKRRGNKKNKQQHSGIVEEKLVKKEEEKKPIEKNNKEESKVEESKEEDNKMQQEKQKQTIEEIEDIVTTDKFSGKQTDLCGPKNAPLIKEVTMEEVKKIQITEKNSSFSSKTCYNKYREYFDIFRVFHHYNTSDSLLKIEIKILNKDDEKNYNLHPKFIRHKKKNIFFAIHNNNLSKKINDEENKKAFDAFQNERFFVFTHLEKLNQKYLVGFHKKGCTFDFLQPTLFLDPSSREWPQNNSCKERKYYFKIDSDIFLNATPPAIGSSYNPIPSEKNVEKKENIVALMNIFLKFLEIFVNDGEECLLKEIARRGMDCEIFKKKIASFDIMRTVYLALHSQFLFLDLNNTEAIVKNPEEIKNDEEPKNFEEIKSDKEPKNPEEAQNPEEQKNFEEIKNDKEPKNFEEIKNDEEPKNPDEVQNPEEVKNTKKVKSAKELELEAKKKLEQAKDFYKKVGAKEKEYKVLNKQTMDLLRQKTQEALTAKEYNYFKSFLIQGLQLNSCYYDNLSNTESLFDKNIPSCLLDTFSRFIDMMNERVPTGLGPIFKIVALKTYPVFLYIENFLLHLHKPMESVYFDLQKNINFPFEKVKIHDSNWEDIEDSKGESVFDKYIFSTHSNFENLKPLEQILCKRVYYHRDQEFYTKKHVALPIGKKTMKEIDNLTDYSTRSFIECTKEQVKLYCAKLIKLSPKYIHEARKETRDMILERCTIYRDLFLWINLFENNLGRGKKLPLKGVLVHYKTIEYLSERYVFITNLVNQKKLNSSLMFKIFSYINNKNFSLSLENFNDTWSRQEFVEKNKFLHFLDEAYKTLLYLPLEDCFYSKMLTSQQEMQYLVFMMSFDHFYCSRFGLENQNRYLRDMAKNRLLELTKKNHK